MGFCKFLKNKRKEKKITLQALADKLHYTRQYIYCMENGQNKPFQSYEKLNQLAKALGLNKQEEYELYTLASGKNGVPADIINILKNNKNLYDEIRKNFSNVEDN